MKNAELTKAEIEGRVQSFAYEKFFREEVPGYEDSKIIGLSHQIGVRETRRVYGEHRLTKEECLEGEIPDSTILLCGAPIEDHRKGKGGEDETYWEYIPGSGVYGVPMVRLFLKEVQMHGLWADVFLQRMMLMQAVVPWRKP